MTAKILGSMLNHACIGFVYYYGCMGNKKKSKALETFREDANTKVFVSKSILQSLPVFTVTHY